MSSLCGGGRPWEVEQSRPVSEKERELLERYGPHLMPRRDLPEPTFESVLDPDAPTDINGDPVPLPWAVMHVGDAWEWAESSTPQGGAE